MKSPILAIVTPCFNEAEVLPETVSKLHSVVDALITKKIISSDSFILFVDDGSWDKTWQIITKSSENFNRIKGIKLSRNQGHQNALIAGMHGVIDQCDCLISIDADLQQDENAISVFVQKYLDGVDVVLGIRNDRKSDSIFKRLTAIAFYKFMVFMGVNVIKNHADYRLLSNRANKALLDFHEVNLFLRGLIPLIGFKTDFVYFDVKERSSGESKYTLLKMISLAFDGITSFSIAPLRMISVLGALIFLVSLFMTMYILTTALFTDKAIPGWASTVLPIYFIGGVQLLSIGVLGEYIGKIYKETKKRPRYIVEKEV
jgi:glycosyltransferase involved in cell wall biosynthesis